MSLWGWKGDISLGSVLEVKSVVVHFQSQAFNPEWEIVGRLLAYELVDAGEEQLIGELQLGGVK
jgi:hypothetical protein